MEEGVAVSFRRWQGSYDSWDLEEGEVGREAGVNRGRANDLIMIREEDLSELVRRRERERARDADLRRGGPRARDEGPVELAPRRERIRDSELRRVRVVQVEPPRVAGKARGGRVAFNRRRNP